MAGCRQTRMQPDNNLYGFVRQDAPDYIGRQKIFPPLFVWFSFSLFFPPPTHQQAEPSTPLVCPPQRKLATLHALTEAPLEVSSLLRGWGCGGGG